MPLHRFLKYINILIGIVLTASLAVFYWCAWRPLPRISGTVQAPVTQPVRVGRDAIGVPHIEAGSIEDAVFAQGYVMAQDRLWQMDMVRRRAAGEVAEVAGAGAPVELDREMRAFRFRRLAQQLETRLSNLERSVLAAYARGVNYYIDTHRGQLPLEFTLLSYHPRPWSVRDSLLTVYLMFRDLNRTWRTERAKNSMLASGDPKLVNTLFPVHTALDVQPGSNAWAVSGSRTATGKPILANDPHLEFSVPSIWYMVRLKAPGLNASGATLPGVPLVVVGHNERIAWGVTNLEADVQDLYREKLDTKTGRYEYAGRIEQAALEREPIAVKGARPVDYAVWVTRHGPVTLFEDQQSYALRWTASDLDGVPLLSLNQARNWREFRAALARWRAPAQNFVYADIDGNIGFQVAGLVPLRNGYAGDVPADGASGEQEWAGFIPFEDLPSVYNPPSGVIVTANQNPFPAAYRHPVNGAFAAPYRARQIRALLDSRQKLKVEDMLAIQTDVYSAFAHFLAGQVVTAYERRKANNPALNDAIALLKEWNGQMRHDLAAPMIASLVYQHLRKAVAERAAPGKGLVYAHQSATAVLEEMLRARPAGWFADWDQILLRSLADAIEEGKRMQGANTLKWKLGEFSKLTLSHPVIGRVPYLGKYFDAGPTPISGSSTTVKQMTERLGPSMRMVLDTADWDRSVANIVMGQSGQLFSGHYRDQWQAYCEGHSFPSRFRNPEPKSVLTLEPPPQ